MYIKAITKNNAGTLPPLEWITMQISQLHEALVSMHTLSKINELMPSRVVVQVLFYENACVTSDNGTWPNDTLHLAWKVVSRRCLLFAKRIWKPNNKEVKNKQWLRAISSSWMIMNGAWRVRFRLDWSILLWYGLDLQFHILGDKYENHIIYSLGTDRPCNYEIWIHILIISSTLNRYIS